MKFPVIGFGKDSSVTIFKDNDELSRCTKVAFKNGYHKGLAVIDSAGIQYEVVGAKRIGTIGPFWGYNLLLDQKLKVELEINNSHPVQLVEIKEKIRRWVNKDKHLWESEHGSIKTMEDKVEKTTDFESLLLLLK
jgi:hypothetical protein